MDGGPRTRVAWSSLVGGSALDSAGDAKEVARRDLPWGTRCLLLSFDRWVHQPDDEEGVRRWVREGHIVSEKRPEVAISGSVLFRLLIFVEGLCQL